MLHLWLDWHRSSLSAGLGLARLAATVTGLDGVLAPTAELLERTLAAGGVITRSLAQVLTEDAGGQLAVATLAESPFHRLLSVKAAYGQDLGPFLLIAPCSGYATVVVSPLVLALARLGEVIVTEWVDARLIPAAEGPFGLAEQIDLGLAAARAIGRPAHLVSLSQSGPAMLALSDRLVANEPLLRPKSLAFLGCQLDPSRNPTDLQRSLASVPRDVLVGQLVTNVGAGYPGVGRRVYPALLQLLAYSVASPGLYAATQQGLLGELVGGKRAGFDRQHMDVHSLADVPAELFLDMLAWMLDPKDGKGAMTIARRPVEPARLRDLPVLTIEAAADELVGQGQTHAIHARLGHAQGAKVTLPRGRHHDLFTGPEFAARTGAALGRFYCGLGDA